MKLKTWFKVVPLGLTLAGTSLTGTPSRAADASGGEIPEATCGQIFEACQQICIGQPPP